VVLSRVPNGFCPRRSDTDVWGLRGTGPAWQRPEETDGTGQLRTIDWAGVIAVLGRRKENGPQ
jgi:hypothetical protein